MVQYTKKDRSKRQEGNKMEFTQVIEKRYSCKNFGERKVEDAKLRAILEAGRLAPTAKHFQEQRI